MVMVLVVGVVVLGACCFGRDLSFCCFGENGVCGKCCLATSARACITGQQHACSS